MPTLKYDRLFKDGVVYFAAGRSSYLDGGLRFYAVNAVTGEILHETCYNSIGDEQELVEKRARGTFNDILLYDGQSLFLKNVTIDPDTFEMDVVGWSYIPGPRAPWPGSPLSAIGGFLDDSLFDRVGWVLDHKLIAKLIVYNDNAAFGMKWRENHSFWHLNLFKVGESEFTVFGQRRTESKTESLSSNKLSLEADWALAVPARVKAMVLTGNALFFAGSRWDDEPDSSLDLLDDDSVGLIAGVDALSGKLLTEFVLDSSPVWDGMAAANGSLFLSTKDGQLLCLGGQK
jgi:hypothetical protein